MLGLVLAVLASLVVGVLAGLLTGKKAQRWCPGCGVTLTCPNRRHPHPTGAAAVAWNAPTRPQPNVTDRPLLTRGQRWRSNQRRP